MVVHKKHFINFTSVRINTLRRYLEKITVYYCLGTIFYKDLFIFTFFGCGGFSLLRQAFTCREQGLLLVVVCKLLLAVTSLLKSSSSRVCMLH